MVEKFEVGKTYRYTGEIGNYSPFTGMHIALDDAKIIVSGNPLVCTYSESEDSFDDTPRVGFKGMRHEHDGWAFQSRWHMFEEIEETKEAREETKMVKFEVGKKYRYTGSTWDKFDFTKIGINEGDAEYIASGKPLTVEVVYRDTQVKFKEFENPWSFLSTMLERFEEVVSPALSYTERQAQWVKDNNIVHGSKVRLLRSYEPNEEGYVTEYPYSGKKTTKHPIGQVFRVCYDDPHGGIVLAPTYDDFECDIGNYFPYFVLEKVADDTPVYGEPVAPPTKSVKEFEAGKWYVCHLTKRPADWNPSGKMDALLDGKPHKCVFGKTHIAEFEGMAQQGDGGWSFWRDLDYFEEVPAPTTNVDWQKKYTELKRKAIAMLSAYGDASKSFTEELESL